MKLKIVGSIPTGIAMDILEMKQEEAMQETDRRVAEDIAAFNEHPVGTTVRHKHDGKTVKTVSPAYDAWPIAVVDVEGETAVPLRDLEVV